MDEEQQSELKELEKSLEVLRHMDKLSRSPADDAAIQMSVLLLLATRLQRLTVQLDYVTSLIRRSL